MVAPHLPESRSQRASIGENEVAARRARLGREVPPRPSTDNVRYASYSNVVVRR